MTNLRAAIALTVAAVIALRLLPDRLLDPIDLVLLVYVGTVSLASVILTTQRTAIWTRLGVGVVFGALAVAVENLHDAAVRAGLLDAGAQAFYLALMTDIVRAVLAVGYTYLALGWITAHAAEDGA